MKDIVHQDEEDGCRRIQRRLQKVAREESLSALLALLSWGHLQDIQVGKHIFQLCIVLGFFWFCFCVSSLQIELESSLNS